MARYMKLRRANSVLTLGSCNCPFTTARVWRTDTSLRWSSCSVRAWYMFVCIDRRYSQSRIRRHLYCGTSHTALSSSIITTPAHGPGLSASRRPASPGLGEVTWPIWGTMTGRTAEGGGQSEGDLITESYTTTYICMCNALHAWLLAVRSQCRWCVSETGCPPPADVIHGQRTELLQGGVVSFKCSPGFELSGHAVMYCNGLQWNGTEPSCQRK